jgi:hypothetical protein
MAVLPSAASETEVPSLSHYLKRGKSKLVKPAEKRCGRFIRVLKLMRGLMRFGIQMS